MYPLYCFVLQEWRKSLNNLPWPPTTKRLHGWEAATLKSKAESHFSVWKICREIRWPSCNFCRETSLERIWLGWTFFGRHKTDPEYWKRYLWTVPGSVSRWNWCPEAVDCISSYRCPRGKVFGPVTSNHTWNSAFGLEVRYLQTRSIIMMLWLVYGVTVVEVIQCVCAWA